MTNKNYVVKIINSPVHSNLEIAGDLVIKLHVPYSKKLVTVKINPNIMEYKSEVAKNVKQSMKTIDTDETQTLNFDFDKNNIHEIEIQGKNYRIKLENIGVTKEDGQEFPTFEFLITET